MAGEILAICFSIRVVEEEEGLSTSSATVVLMPPEPIHPFSAESLDAFLSLSGVKPLKVQIPPLDTQFVRLLVESSIERAPLGRQLRGHFGKPFLVVHPGDSLSIAQQLLHFMRDDVMFSVQDRTGIIVYVQDSEKAQGHARGKQFLNVETFRTFTDGLHLSIMRASDAHRTHVRSYFKMRARGFEDVPGENLDLLFEQQRGLITREELIAAVTAPEEDLKWGVPIEGPHLGSEDFFVPFLDRDPSMLYAQVRAALEVVAPTFGLRLEDERPIQYAVKYKLAGVTGSVTLVFHNAPVTRKGLSYVVAENPALRIASNTLVPMLLHVLRARVS